LLLACGLDSAQLGEHEIAGPAARRVGGFACRNTPADRSSTASWVEALGMARRVRRLSAGVRSPSLGDLAADRVLQHLGGRPGRVALLACRP